MGRPKRAAVGGLIYHVLNRANARTSIFEKDGDYEAFERILADAIERTGTRLNVGMRIAIRRDKGMFTKADSSRSQFKTIRIFSRHVDMWNATPCVPIW